MDPSIGIEVVWCDEHVVELRVVARNERFAAQTDCYVGRDGLAEFAAAIEGFPRSGEDRREHVLGTMEPDCAHGGVRLVFRRCSTSSGSTVDVEVHNPDDADIPEQASFSVPIEAAALDSFVGQLRRLRPTVGASATLQGTG